MYNFEINKINVFISSKCGAEYTIVRKALKALLDETGFCYVYCFENDYGSSLNVKSAYLSELSKSDVVIFLIDNMDGVTDPVQSEIDKARELNIKCIFLFCNENQKEPTPLQRDLRNRNLEKYYEVTKFSDMAYEAYKSIITDVIRIYRTGNMENNISTSVEAFEISRNINSKTNEIISFKKETQNQLKSIYSIIPGILGQFTEKKEGDLFSINIGILLKSIIGYENIDNVNFAELRDDIISLYDDKYKEIITLRIDAVEKYLKGKLEDAESMFALFSGCAKLSSMDFERYCN